jgi:predicted phage tail protein
MSTANKSIHRATISLDVPTRIADVILYANNIVQKMTSNPSFPAPTPTIAALTAAVDDLHAAETATLSRARGTATVRNDKRTVLVSLLQQLRGYVQSVADATPESGAAIIQSAGLAVRKITAPGKRAFAARAGALAGSAIVTAAVAGPRSAYEWQYSTDGGKTWVSAPTTTQSKTTIAGLPPGTTVQFRYLAVTPKGGQGDWSQPVSALVK